MRSVRRAVAGAVLGLGGLAAAVVIASAATSSNSATFPDPAGDAPNNSADFTLVSISNDDAGRIEFRITFANRTSIQTTDAIYVYLDTDRNTATGNVGSDYRIQAFGGGGSGLARWSGSSWDDVSSPTIAYSFAGQLVVSMQQSDLGGTAAFNFFAADFGDGKTGDFVPDTATDGARLSYSFAAPATTSTTTTATTPPPPPPPPKNCKKTSTPALDPNGDGCAGPFPVLKLRLPSHAWGTANGSTYFKPFAVGGVPRGATVAFAYGSARERVSGKSGTVRSRILSDRPLRDGTKIVVTATATGRIGDYAAIRVLTVSPGLRVVKRLCIPAIGSKTPRPCAKVSRGR